MERFVEEISPHLYAFYLFSLGFITVTYVLDGAFVHRDSVGVRQWYGNSQQNPESNNKHTQWLHTGSGMLHEEMFDSSNWLWQRQELYQLWLNVPAAHKWTRPSSVLLGGVEDTPLVTTNNTATRVLAGEFAGQVAAAPVVTDICILHVQIAPGGEWSYRVPKSPPGAIWT